MESTKRKKTALWILGAAVVIGGLVYGGVCWNRGDRVEALLLDYATSLNTNCPRDLEPGMTLKRVVNLPDHVLVYNIESSVLTRDMVEKDSVINRDTLQQTARNNALRSLQADPDLPRIRRLGITFKYNYTYMDGSPFMEFTITPDDYR